MDNIEPNVTAEIQFESVRNKEMTTEQIIEEVKKTTIAGDEIGGNDEDEELVLEEDKRSLLTDKSDPTIESLVAKFTRNSLILQPEYQRKYVMKPAVASSLIESLLLDIPIPVIYLAEEIDNKWSVIDGQQRLTAIISFVRGNFLDTKKEFKLSGLKVMKELNRMSFQELSEENKEKILNTPIRSIIIKKESNEDIKFEIFERLNTGSTPLNEDEIRNTLYRGKYIQMLKDLENEENFNLIVNKPNFKNRMLYRGMILRFLAIYDKSYLGYRQSMKQFCNKHLKQYQNLDSIKEKEFRDIFKKCISLVFTVFGEDAFRRLIKEENSNNSKWVKSRINLALFDIQMWGFVKYPKETIIRNADIIRETMLDLMTSDEAFMQSLEIQTNDSNVLTKRFDIWRKTLDDLIGSAAAEPRLFSFEVKKTLFDTNPTCCVCHQQILNIYDAHVDHIIPFSIGGKTELSNAQLTHRFCNQSKGNTGSTS